MLAIELLAGLVLLIAGGEMLVRGASALATRAGVSPLLIGLTLVGFGTSSPELVTSVQAALIGSPGIAIGNIVGSNIANMLLILGVSALLAPIQASRASVYRDGAVVLASAGFIVLAAWFGTLDRAVGAVLVAGLAVYLGFAWWSERNAPPAAPEATPAGASSAGSGMAMSVGLTLAGLVGVVLGGRFLVSGAVELAGMLGVSETVIGLTVVAIGTSLPELVTSFVAAYRRQPEIAFGNVLGSNIYNVLGIGGITALIAPVDVPMEMLRFDMPVMLAISVLMLVFARTNWRLGRREGGVLLAGYAAYLFVLWP